jgi:hypothetical protein|tara:strand:- start:909 stop:1055 length:147 start_codon:yes stop_codon:yes gene_type:complete
MFSKLIPLGMLMFSHHQILAEDGAVVPDDNSYYIPPYTDDDPTIDTDE